MAEETPAPSLRPRGARSGTLMMKWLHSSATEMSANEATPDNVTTRPRPRATSMQHWRAETADDHRPCAQADAGWPEEVYDFSLSFPRTARGPAMHEIGRLLGVALVLGASVSSATAQDWAAEVYGGHVFDRSEVYNTVDFDLGSGSALGFGIYGQNLIPGVELGVDVMRTDAGYTGFLSGVESLSVMMNARLPFQIAPGTTAYVSAGLGAIRVTYDGSTQFPAFTGDDNVAGAQVGIGVRYSLASTFGVFAEVKHQVALDDATIVGLDQSYSSTSAVIGLRVGF